MNKIFFLIFLLILTFSECYCQYNSLLSANGEGRILSPVFSTNRLAGELSAAYSSSNVNNFQNPASYADATLTNIEVGTYGENGSYDYLDSTKSSGGAGLTHFSMLMPLSAGKSGLGVGFYKSSATEYGYRNTTNDPLFGTMKRTLSGVGNTYNAYIGSGIRVADFKFGANMIVNFGNVSYNSDLSFTDSLKLPVLRELNSISNFGFAYNLGVQYDLHLAKNKQLLFGGYYSGNFHRNGSDQILRQNIYNQGLQSEQFIKLSDTVFDIAIPTSSKFGIGVSYIYNKAILIGTEVNFANYSALKSTLDSTSLQNAWFIHFGMEYKPFLNRNIDNRKYFNRLTYRIGAVIGKNEQNLSGSVNDFKIMAGITLPVLSRSVGYITTGLEFQQRNDNGINKISESILSFKFILTFADKWFIRSKFD